MKTRRLLKLSMLIEQKACSGQIKLFKKLFGEQIFVTERRCTRMASRFDFIWAAAHLLSTTAQAGCQRAIAKAWADNDRAFTPLGQAQAWADCQRAIAIGFAKAYLGDES